MRYLGQVIAYGTFFGLVALLSIQPELRLLADEQAVVSLTFSHTGKRLGECRRLSQEEQMALPPNMRKPDECPRERHALSIRMLMDNKLLYSVTLPPTGIWQDGKSTVYQRFPVAAGQHEFAVQMNDSGSKDGYDFEASASVQLQPGQNLVVRFDDATQQFIFR